MLKRMGLKPEAINLDKMKADFSELQRQKFALKQQYSFAKKEHEDLEKREKKLRLYLRQNNSQNCNNKLHTFAPHHTCGVMS